MNDNKLKPCWKCGGQPFYVKENGYKDLRIIDGDFVSCKRECMPISEKYTVDEWQNHTRAKSVEEPAMSELADVEFGDPYCRTQIPVTKQALDQIAKWIKENMPAPKKLTWLQKIRGYDELVRELEIKENNSKIDKFNYSNLQSRCQAAESMRDHWKSAYETASKLHQFYIDRTAARIKRIEWERGLSDKVADVWQQRLICVQKDYADATAMIGRRLKWKSGNIEFVVIVGNPVTLLDASFPPLDNYDEDVFADMWFDFSVCKQGDTFNWKKGVMQALFNFFKKYVQDADIQSIIQRDLYAKYQELK